MLVSKRRKHDQRHCSVKLHAINMLTPTGLWNLVFNALCIAGCVYQIQNIVLSYFKFYSITRNKYSRPDVLHYPNLHYCLVAIEDLLNISAIEEKYSISVNRSNYQDYFSLLDIISLYDIMQHTPDGEVTDCLIRDDTGDSIIYSNNHVCEEYFNIKKYIVQQYLCYLISTKEDRYVSFDAVEKSLDLERMMYQIKISGISALYRKIRPTITTWRYPLVEWSYAPAYYKSANENLAIKVSCQNITAHLLGYPYDKFTCNTNDIDDFQCIDSCIEEKTHRNFNRLPYTSFYGSSYERLHMKRISHSMIANKTIAKMIQKIRSDCSISCPIHKCDYNYCLMIGSADTSVAVYGDKVSSTLRVESPGMPYFSITFVPLVPLLDFIIYIFSSLGTWFGFVVISCNPILLIYRKNYRSIGRHIHRRYDRRDMVLRRMVAPSRFYERYATTIPK